jgi:hypothetical protein
VGLWKFWGAGLGWSVVAWREGEAFGRKFFEGFCRSLAECFAPTVVGILGWAIGMLMLD